MQQVGHDVSIGREEWANCQANNDIICNEPHAIVKANTIHMSLHPKDIIHLLPDIVCSRLGSISPVSFS